ncbi:hypothetical protein AXF42_Ash004451 [Apostasia shenzhenica]|uniref:Uncharacterized protein n=1 Tax=Apostasia shenzhenica TaxID=1088818 RepID=A0A2I0BGQ0_9ASPA|nr:hypothetical protein AXF42_Ash004451 [Apostasia shenzhenica]
MEEEIDARSLIRLGEVHWQRTTERSTGDEQQRDPPATSNREIHRRRATERSTGDEKQRSRVFRLIQMSQMIGAMAGGKAIILALALLAVQMPHVFPFPNTVPAFLWSRLEQGYFNYFCDSGIKEALKEMNRSPNGKIEEFVNYQTISPKDLAKFVLLKGGWASFMCCGQNFHQNVDVAVVFVGKELLTSHISRRNHEDPVLLDLLKSSFMNSNLSVAFPYISVTDEKDTLENSLISGFIENCGHGLEVKHIAYMESCSLEGENLKKLHGMHSFEDFIGQKKESGVSGATDLVIFCGGCAQESKQTGEGKVLSKIVNLLEQSGSTYTILYASDPYRSYPDASDLAMRFLAEGNDSTNSTRCDGVCQLKSTLLEGFFVAVQSVCHINGS